MEPSIFTRIINGEIPCHKIYEDEKVIVFLDIHPIGPGHTLVVSKQQTDHMWDLGDNNYQAMFAVAKMLAPKIRQVFGKQRTVLIVEGYDTPHAHLHLIPADSHKGACGEQDMESEPDHAALAVIATKIKESL